MAVAISRTADLAGVVVANTATYSGVSIGAATADRIIVVCSGNEENGGASPSSATIDYGSGATAMTAGTLAQFGSVTARIFYLAVPTGTTATIVITWSGPAAATENHSCVYRVVGGRLPVASAGTNTSTDMDASAPLTTGAITIPTDGGFIAVAAGASNAAKTWANATEDLDSQLGAYTFTTATSTTAGSPTVTCTGSNNEDGALAWVVFNPSLDRNLSPAVGSAALSGVTPSKVVAHLKMPAAAAVSLTASAPLAITNWPKFPAAGSLTLSTAAPVAFFEIKPTPVAGALALAADAPNVVATQGGNTDYEPSAASLSLSAQSPLKSIFAAGQYDETGETGSLNLQELSFTELEFGLVLDPANYSVGDRLDFRVYLNGQALTAYDFTAEILAPAIPAAALLSLSADAASLVLALQLSPPVGSLLLSAEAPDVVATTSEAIDRVPAAAALSLTADAPSKVINFPAIAASGTLTLNGTISVLVQNEIKQPAAGALSLSAAPPTLGGNLQPIPDAAALSLTGDAPQLKLVRQILPNAAALSLTGQTPIPALDRRLQPSSGAILLSANAPSIGGGIALSPPSASLALAATTPTVSRFVAGQYDETGETAPIDLPAASYTELEFGLVLSPSDYAIADRLAFRVYFNGQPLTGYDVTAQFNAPAFPVAASLQLSSDAPSLNYELKPKPNAGALVLSAPVPIVSVSSGLLPAAADLSVSAQAPRLSQGAILRPASAVLALVGETPVSRRDIILPVASRTLLLSAAAPSIRRESSAPQEWLVCASIAITPEMVGDVELDPALQGLVEMNAALEAALDMKEC